jgi:NAD(P)-dependent dehydrogenase (short-subunit alcohol dehydrogenase family)
MSTVPQATTGIDATPDRVALVTGAAGGIGHATVQELVARGWRVLATDIAPEATFDAPPDIVRYVAADVTDREQIGAAVRAAEELGTFLAAIANAGVVAEDFSAFVDVAPVAWSTTLSINVLGVLNTFQAATEALLRGGRGGRLAASSSVAGVRAEPHLAAYSASKAAINSIVRSLALELGADGITVNGVAPGPVQSELQDRVIAERNAREPGVAENAADRFERHRNEGRPIGRLATPEEVGGTFCWLLSDAAAYVTGQVIVVDGGGVLV